jgi:hypothetical protein
LCLRAGNHRERRRLRGWVRRYLRHLRDDAGVGDEVGDVCDDVTAAVRAVDGWLAAGDPAALN